MINIATLDIETSSLNADYGIVLCGVFKRHEKHSRPIVFRGDKLNKLWATKRSNDSEVVRAIAEQIEEFDVIVAHNGLKFDIPFLRTRMALWNMDAMKEIKVVDPVQILRNKFKMSYNSQEKFSSFLGFCSKTQVSGDMWIRAALDGDKEAMDYVVEHCVRDVEDLHKMIDSVKGYSSAFNAWGSAR